MIFFAKIEKVNRQRLTDNRLFLKSENLKTVESESNKCNDKRLQSDKRQN